MNVPRRIITNIKPNIIEDLGNGKFSYQSEDVKKRGGEHHEKKS